MNDKELVTAEDQGKVVRDLNLENQMRAETDLAECLDSYPKVDLAPIIPREKDPYVELINWKRLRVLMSRINGEYCIDMPGEVILEIAFPQEGQPWNVALIKFVTLQMMTDALPLDVHMVVFEKSQNSPYVRVPGLTTRDPFFKERERSIQEIVEYFIRTLSSFLREQGIQPKQPVDQEIT